MRAGKIPWTPIVCNTAYHNKGAEFEEVGFDGYISKPIKIESLVTELSKLMHTNQLAPNQAGRD